MIFREGSLTALIEAESTVLGIRTHVGRYGLVSMSTVQWPPPILSAAGVGP